MFQVHLEKTCRSLEDQQLELKARNDQHLRQLADVTDQKARFQAENGTLQPPRWSHLADVVRAAESTSKIREKRLCACFQLNFLDKWRNGKASFLS